MRKLRVLAFLVAGLAFADVVEMTDGSKLMGTARRLADGKLAFRTSFAGDIEIDWTQVKTLETENPELVKLKPSKVAPPENPRVAGRVWSYEIAADLAGKSGNTDKMDYGFKATAILKGDRDQLKLSAAIKGAEAEGEKTEDNLTLAGDYERQINNLSNWYARTEYLEDNFKALDYRSTTAVGFGHYFLKEPTHSLRGRGGFFYQHEAYDGSSEEGSNDVSGLDLGINHMIQLGEWAKLVTEVIYLPSFVDLNDYNILHETALDLPIGKSKLWKLRLGIANEYDSQTAEDKEKLDTSYFVRLVLNWERGKFFEQ